MIVLNIIILLVVAFCITLIWAILKELYKRGRAGGFTPVVITFFVIYLVLLFLASQGFIMVLMDIIGK